MNIFYLDLCPKQAAKMQCDKHVVKMILESVQLLHAPYYAVGIEDLPYKKTHYNHPCAVWVRESYKHYSWLRHHTVALLREYTKRYGKEHACKDVLRRLTSHEFRIFKCFSHEEFVDPPRAFGQSFATDTKDAVEAYREYYCWKSANIDMTWKNSDEPEWFFQL